MANRVVSRRARKAVTRSASGRLAPRRFRDIPKSVAAFFTGKDRDMSRLGRRTLEILAEQGRDIAGRHGSTSGEGQRIAGRARRELARREKRS